ncbi:glycosyltransferase family 87 protein [Burkholderia sp. 22PA0099]|uniref:glycosyltransferase family 87 protein n=1 Tax=Burkholderia sp. 22PA0099 TaxID=3237372 RepID=UPI0039C3A146
MASSPQRFFNASRLLAYAGTILLVVQAFGVVVSAMDGWKQHGHPIGYDFQAFWVASHLTLAGTPLKAYDWNAYANTFQLISPHAQLTGPWFYPPNFLLMVWPFALLSSPVGYVIFEAITTLLFVLLIRRTMASVPNSLVLILAFTGLWLNAAQGQNAALTASLALAALLALNTRPVLAGVFIGLLSIKPHLAILFPVALACAGMWTAFIAAGVTAAIFTAISIGVFGVGIVHPFLEGLSHANAAVASGRLPWKQMASLFASLRVFHVGIGPAYIAQACQAVLALAAVGWVWRHSKALEVRATALVGGTFLISPYMYNYDGVWLGIPLALLAAASVKHGWLRGERWILVVAWLYPALGNLSEDHLKIGFGPLVFWALLLVAVRRTRLAMRVERMMPTVDTALPAAAGSAH